MPWAQAFALPVSEDGTLHVSLSQPRGTEAILREALTETLMGGFPKAEVAEHTASAHQRYLVSLLVCPRFPRGLLLLFLAPGPLCWVSSSFSCKHRSLACIYYHLTAHVRAHRRVSSCVWVRVGMCVSAWV